MGVGHRVFLVDQDGKLHKFSQKKFDDFRRGDIGLPERFVGMDKVKYALLVYETYNRKPVELYQEDYGILPLGPDGSIDKRRRTKGMSLLFQAHSPLDEPGGAKVEVRAGSGTSGTDSVVIDGTKVFAEKRLEHEWRWQPSVDVREQIYKSVFRY